MSPTVSQALADQGQYVSHNWLSQTARYPFLQDPYRQIGLQPTSHLSPDLQGRMSSIGIQISSVLGICSCKINRGSRISIEPFTDSSGPFSVSSGLQAVVDLQTGHLYISRQPIDLIKSQQADWQQFLQFLITV